MEIVRQPGEQRMLELVELGAEPMDEDDRPPLPRFGVVDAVAVDVDEFPEGGTSCSARAAILRVAKTK